jgi:predicted RNase H-like HicB family nuclease
LQLIQVQSEIALLNLELLKGNEIALEDNLKLIQEIICKSIKSMIIRTVIEWDEKAQSYSATCPELNFVSSFGDTKEKAIANLEDAIKLMLEPIKVI